MTVKAVVVTMMLSAMVSSTNEALAAQKPSHASDSRLGRVEHWIATVLHHSPGLIDDDLVAVGEWSNGDLELLIADATALVRVLRNPRLASESEAVAVSLPGDRPGTRRPVRYTPAELARLKQLACAIGTFASAPTCEWTRRAIADDPFLSSVASAAPDIRDANGNFILYRGALIHSDVAMLGLAVTSAPSFAPGSQSVRMTISDGHQSSFTQPDVHWELARQLLDQVAPDAMAKPSPGRDEWVRRWYVATATWMQRDGHHYDVHLKHGREIFPDDADLAMLEGAQHETYASASVQTAVRSAVLPTGVKLEVASERAELREAEKLLRHATELRPVFPEAQIRLGHVLELMDRDAEASSHLNGGLKATDEPLLQYYGSLFLGIVEEKLHHDAAAKACYERAAMLYSSAQSPLLGLSELARRGGHREEALRHMEKVYDIRFDRKGTDPWWTYTYSQGRNADLLLDAVEKPFRLTATP